MEFSTYVQVTTSLRRFYLDNIHNLLQITDTHISPPHIADADAASHECLGVVCKS